MANGDMAGMKEAVARRTGMQADAPEAAPQEQADPMQIIVGMNDKLDQILQILGTAAQAEQPEQQPQGPAGAV